MDSDSDVPPSPRSDLISGGVWVVIGIAIGIGSWRMDRLANQGVPGFAAPGLLPGILGVLITLTGLAIVLRSLRRGAATAPDASPPLFTGRALLTLALCLGFAAGLVGHGLPFPIAAAVYLFAHIFLLQLPERRAAGTVARGALVAATIAVVASGTISFVFQYLFLVRLP
jgi:putative tricarboxylic transport membrane protein